jgi:hypothetical protein
VKRDKNGAGWSTIWEASRVAINEECERNGLLIKLALFVVLISNLIYNNLTVKKRRCWNWNCSRSNPTEWRRIWILLIMSDSNYLIPLPPSPNPSHSQSATTASLHQQLNMGNSTSVCINHPFPFIFLFIIILFTILIFLSVFHSRPGSWSNPNQSTKWSRYIWFSLTNRSIHTHTITKHQSLTVVL